MLKEYSDYGYWNKPYFLAKAERAGPDTKNLIKRVMEKFQHPVQSFYRCYGIFNFAEKYGKEALEECCHDTILYGKCNYTYIPIRSPCMQNRHRNRWTVPSADYHELPHGGTDERRVVAVYSHKAVGCPLY